MSIFVPTVSSSSQATPRKVKTTDAELDSVDGMPRSIVSTLRGIAFKLLWVCEFYTS